MRRLFSTFAPGMPGVGLLLLRLVAGVSVVVHAVASLRSGLTLGLVMAEIPVVAGGILLIAGLWTPIAGALVAAAGFWNAIACTGDPYASIFLGTMGAALALLGPGAWSIDARLFGWKRIDVRNQKR